jgi:hypothetical protein
MAHMPIHNDPEADQLDADADAVLSDAADAAAVCTPETADAMRPHVVAMETIAQSHEMTDAYHARICAILALMDDRLSPLDYRGIRGHILAFSQRLTPSTEQRRAA